VLKACFVILPVIPSTAGSSEIMVPVLQESRHLCAQYSSSGNSVRHWWEKEHRSSGGYLSLIDIKLFKVHNFDLEFILGQKSEIYIDFKNENITIKLFIIQDSSKLSECPVVCP
jgi:hypothetical protein